MNMCMRARMAPRELNGGDWIDLVRSSFSSCVNIEFVTFSLRCKYIGERVHVISMYTD